MVNDGSTDRTPVIAREYAARWPWLRVIDKANGGLASARNAGLDVATGDAVTFVDSDDYVPAGAFAMMTRALEDTGADMVLGAYAHPGDEDNKLQPSQPEILTGREAAAAMLYQKRDGAVLNSSAWGKVYRRELWRTARFPDGRYYEDLFIVPIVTAGCERVAVVKAPVYCYRINPEGILANFSERHCDCVEAGKVLREAFAGDTVLSKAARSRLLSAAFNLLLRITDTGADMPGAKYECWKIIREYRGKELTDRRARLKNRVGAAMSYFPFLLRSKWLCSKVLTR